MSETRDIEQWDIGDIRPYERNAKLHPPEQVDKIARSIRKFGWTQPIVVDGEGVIIAGHGRHLAALELGYTKVPVLVRDDLDEDAVDQARIADNAVAGKEYDEELWLTEIGRHADDLEGMVDDAEIKMGRDMLELGDMDIEATTNDIEVEVEALAEQNESAAAALAQLAKAFGFTRIRPETARLIKRFMAQVETETDARGEEALSAWLSRLYAEGSVIDE